MKNKHILFLGPKRLHLIDFLISQGYQVNHTEEPIHKDSIILKNIDFIVSYGYKHIIKEEVIDDFLKKIINLHISYLPWNKGRDPNLWSFLEDTPKGVTIHYIDKGLDTGDILIQEKISYYHNDTLRTTYERLSHLIEELFMKNFEKIITGKIKSFPQPHGGTYHRLSDRKKVEHLLTKGWDTPIMEIIGKAKNL